MLCTYCPVKWGARVTRGASAEARNVPEQTRPLAWTGRKPGCGPASALMASTICRMTGSGVADAGMSASPSWPVVSERRYHNALLLSAGGLRHYLPHPEVTPGRD